MSEIKFTIPGNPIPKGRPKKGANGFYTPERTAKYERLVSQYAQIAMIGRWPLKTPVHVDIEAVFPIPRSWPFDKQKLSFHAAVPDLDNVVKAVIDGCQKIVLVDDKLVASLTARKVWRPVKEGWVKMTVRRCEHAELAEASDE